MLTAHERGYLDRVRRWFSPPASFPVDMMTRLEDGLGWLLAHTRGGPKTDLIGRLTKGDQQRSAVEEILLAQGLVRVFGDERVAAYPEIEETEKRAEFKITSEGLVFFVEATGLTSPQEEELIREGAETGDGYLFFRDHREEIGRFCEKISTKVGERPISAPLLLCLSQYAFGPDPSRGSARIRDIVGHPGDYGIPESIQLLGVSWSYGFRVFGVCLSGATCRASSLCAGTINKIKQALIESYSPPPDGAFDCCQVR